MLQMPRINDFVFRTLHELNSENVKSDMELYTDFVSLAASRKPTEHLSTDSDFDVHAFLEDVVESVCVIETIFDKVIKQNRVKTN